MDLKPCPKCSQLTAYENEVCPYCKNPFGAPGAGHDLQHAGLAGTREQICSPGTAALCAFLFPGWGQWYNGRTVEGIRILFAYLGIAMICGIILLAFGKSHLAVTAALDVSGVLVLMIWIYSVITAYNTALGINRGGILFTGKSVLFWMPATLYIFLTVFVIGIIAASYIPGLPGSGVEPYLARTGTFISTGAMGL